MDTKPDYRFSYIKIPLGRQRDKKPNDSDIILSLNHQLKI